MPRLLFEKIGPAVWISHLDLMRLFQRSFKRAGLSLKHSQGYSPRPYVAVALPLSVGVESVCELLDFDLEGEPVANDLIKDRLNQALTEGIRVLEVYQDAAKIKHLALLDTIVTLEYDAGVPENGVQKLQELFSREEVLVEKKTKAGDIVDQNIVEMIKSMEVEQADEHTILLKARICCQNPTLNPAQLHGAILRHMPELKPDFVKSERVELYDQEGNIFR